MVESALRNEFGLVTAGLHRTEARVRELEQRHGMSTQEFLRRHETGELTETLESVEWVGEYRLLQRLREKAETLREIRFED
jgi:phage shock protein A